MSKAPYPNCPPYMTEVTKSGGFHREVLVLELRTLGRMDPARLAQLVDAVSMDIVKFQDVESFDVVGSDRFDPPLRRAMRLP